MPELLNSLHCRNVKDLCFKHCCTRHGRAAPPPCPSPTSQGQTPHWHPQSANSNNSCKAETRHSHSQPQQRRNNKWEIFRSWWHTGPPALQISFFTAHKKCKDLRDQIKHSQAHPSWVFVPHFHFIFFLKYSSAVQILPRIHLITFPSARSF